MPLARPGCLGHGLPPRHSSRNLRCMNKAIFTKDFKARPFWWEAHEPKPLPEIALPKQARVVIIGAGYAGLNAALELNREGLDCIVLDANEPGFGGSSRNGGMVMRTTLSRKNKSSRNFPSFTICSRLRLVAATKRTSTVIVFVLPMRSKLLVSMKRSNLT